MEWDLTEPLWIGIDLGTQGVRVLAVSASGGVVARSAVALTSHRDGNRHEQDPEEWWSAVLRAAQVVSREVEPDRIGGIACCGTSGTVLLADSVGDPARPVSTAVMYDDGRAADLLVEPELASCSGLARARWLLERTEPATDARVVHQVDLVTSRLIGEPAATDWTNALKTGVEIAAGDWPVDTRDRLGIDRDRLPAVVPPGTKLGEVSPEAAALTGFPTGTPVVAGLTDGCAAQVASGALDVGAWNAVLGTTLVVKGCTTEPPTDPDRVLYSHRSPEGSWWPGGASSAGAGALGGLEVVADRDFAELDALAAEREPAPCLTYPLLGKGERFPFRASDATGFTVDDVGGDAPGDRTVGADELDRYAAVLQGVGFLARLCLEHVERLGAPITGPVRLTGGGARSPYWCRLIAHILGREVQVPPLGESAFGMAVLAAWAVGADGRSAGASLSDVAARLTRALGTTDGEVAAGDGSDPIAGSGDGTFRIAPDPAASHRWAAPYARWCAELSRRGWLPHQ